MTSLGSLTSSEMADGPSSTLVIPLGSTEQHGPHLPLDTDTRIAEALAERVVARLDDALMGPTISIGASGEHQGFAGTLSVGTDVLSSTLVEIVRSAGPEFSRVAVVNAHGGNLEALGRARSVCCSEGRDLAVWTTGLPGADAHAGRTETSIMLALAPELVRLDRVESGVVDPVSAIMPALTAGGLMAVTPNGVLGDPSGATADEGRELLDRLVEDATAALAG